MRTLFTKVLGIATIAAGLAFAGTASAVVISTGFNFVPFGTLTANTGDITTASTITAGAPDKVTSILFDNTGLISGTTIISLTDPTPVTLGAVFTKTFTTLLGTFVENLTVTAVSIGVHSLGIVTAGTITETVVLSGSLLDPTAVFYSAAYTQNAGPGTQINASFNNSTVPPPPVPEPATLALLGLGLAGLGFARRRKQ